MHGRGPSAVSLAIVLACACGPDEDRGDDDWPRDCEAGAPVGLLEGTHSSWQAEPAGERVLLVVQTPTSGPDGEPTGWLREAFAVPKCGGPEVLLERTHISSGSVRRDFGVVGEHIVSCDRETRRMDVHDPTLEASSRVLFEYSSGCGAVAVAGGLAAVDGRSGDLLFADAPGDPRGAVRRILAGARSSGDDISAFDEAPQAWAPGVPRVVGDRVLVAMAAGGLVEVDPVTGASIAYTHRLVKAVQVMDNPRHVAWSDDDGHAYWLDRDRGLSTPVGSDTPLDHIGHMGEWIVDTAPWAPTDPTPTDDWIVLSAINVESSASYTHEGRDPWWFVAPLSSDALLVEIAPEDGLVSRVDHVFWPATHELAPVDFPGNNHDGLYAYRGGLITLQRFPWDDFGTLRALGWDGRTVETVMDRVPHGVRFMHDDRIALIRVDAPGELIVRLPEGEIVTIDQDAERILWPPEELSHKRVPDAEELIYIVGDGERSIVRRTVIP